MQVAMKYSAMNAALASLEHEADCISAFLTTVRSVSKRLERMDGMGDSVKVRLEQVINTMDVQGSHITALRTAGNQALMEYVACENKLAGREYAVADFAQTGLPGQTENKNFFEVNWDPYLSGIGNLGTAGSIISATFGIAYQPESIGKNIAKLVGTGAKMAGKIADGKPIDLLGISTVDAIGFSENLAKELDGYIINNSYNSKNMSVAAKNASNISAVAKWSGVAISGMVNFLDNFEEYNADLSNPRLYTETIGETVVDLTLGAFVGAGVAAMAGATAPVWAVGVVSTGAVMAINWVSEEVTGKNVAELVSDTVLDTVEAAGKYVAAATEYVGNAVSTTIDCISVGWKKFKSLF